MTFDHSKQCWFGSSRLKLRPHYKSCLKWREIVRAILVVFL